MPNYVVYFDEKWCRRVDVVANSPEDAKKVAWEIAEASGSALSEEPSLFPEAWFEIVEWLEVQVAEWDKDTCGSWAGVNNA